jgi:hypothetical protein
MKIILSFDLTQSVYTRTDRFFYVNVCVCMRSVMINKISKQNEEIERERKWRRINEINVKNNTN